MSEYHKRLKSEIRQLQLDTIALRRIRAEMEKELEGELTFNIDMNIEMLSETNNWSK